MLDRRLGGDEDAAHVDRQGPLEVGQRQLFHRTEGEDGGVVDQDVDASEASRRFVDGGDERGRVGAIGMQGQDAGSGAFEFGRQGPGLVRRADVGEGDAGAFGGQPANDGGADAAGTALDEGDFAGEGCRGYGHGNLHRSG